jgi:hypothetical protein
MRKLFTTAGAMLTALMVLAATSPLGGVLAAGIALTGLD